MAKKTTGGGLKNLREHIRNDRLGHVYLLFGEEDYLISYYLEEIKKRILSDGLPEFNYNLFEGSRIDWNEVGESIEALPMMSEKRLVVVRSSGIFKTATESVKSFWQERLKDIPPYVHIVFVEKEVDKRGVLYKAIAAAGEAVECAFLDGAELSNWVARGCREAGKEIAPKEVSYLIRSCDAGMNNIKRELEKLFAYCQTRITVQDIDRIVTKMPQNRVFEMINGIMEKNAASVFVKLEELKTLKESAFRVLGLICTNFERIFHAKLLCEQGTPHSMVAAAIKVPPYYVRDYIDAAKRFSKPFLRHAICSCAKIDYEVKQGKGGDWLAVERFLLECMV